jgi:hypothetical protein
VSNSFRASGSESETSAYRALLLKRLRHRASIWLRELESHEPAVLITLLLVTFLGFFYAADLKGIWNDDAVRLTIANGGLAKASLESRHPGHSVDVIRAIGPFAVQPAYPLLVNRILRLTRSYSIIPIVTTNLFIFLFSAIGIYLLARRLLNAGPRLLAVLLYLWNGFAMVHVLQVREYPLILFFFVYNTWFFYYVLGGSPGRRGTAFWVATLLYCVTAASAFYTTKWAPLFLWPQAIIALLYLRRQRFRSVAILTSLVVAGLSCLPLVLSIQRNSLLYEKWDKRTPSVQLLLSRVYRGTEHLLIGSDSVRSLLLQLYYWGLVVILVGGLIFFVFRFFRQRFEIQHLVLTIIGFLVFQIGYFFAREPLSTWPRYFILYLPYVVLLVPVIISRVLSYWSVPVGRRAWVYLGILLIVAASGLAQIHDNYVNPYVDHGPDFREVYRYLISRVSSRDKIVVGLTTNHMALGYYWPTPNQLELRYKITISQKGSLPANIWTVSYQDEKSEAYVKYADDLKRRGYQLRTSRVVSKVTVRQFQTGVAQDKSCLGLESERHAAILSGGEVNCQ